MQHQSGARPHIARMAPYSLAAFDIPADTRLISLAQNESMRPPSPQVAKALQKCAGGLALYPDPDWRALREALAAQYDIDARRILCGAGSMELIQCLAHAWLDETATIVTSAYAYAFINTVAQYTQATIKHVPEDNFTVSIDDIIAAVDQNTRMVFVANPGNPTGTRIPRSQLRRLRERIPAGTLLVIDEAYAEFSDHLDEPLFDLTESTQTVVLRTFSKAYGLAGARVGWGVFEPSVGEEVRKLLNPNNISLPGQLAACASVHDQAYMRDTCRQTISLRDALISDLKNAGLQPPVSHTNFILIPFDTSGIASRVDALLRSQGMVMRNMAGYGLPHCQRLTIVNEDDMALVRSALLGAIDEASN